MLFQNMFDSKVSPVFTPTERCENHYSLFSSTSRDIWNDQSQMLSRQGSFSSNSTDSPSIHHRTLSRENSVSSHSSLSDSVCNGSQSSGGVKNLLLYKTELCRSYEESGTCRYSDKCQFAHGMSQLRDVPRHPKYKTQICRTFWEQGNCPYGKRCCFIHTVAESQPRAQPGTEWSPFAHPAPSTIQVNPSLASPLMMPTQQHMENKDYFNPKVTYLETYNPKSKPDPSSRYVMDGSYSYSRAPIQAQAQPRPIHAGGIRENVRGDLAQYFWNTQSDTGKQGRLQVFQNFG
ncbi:hypothetical protein K7432_009685 [Basidiobolus ranarum]|uniref:C3H1-type domain-containing protein n=1 Tax=Basidiobolus ranarum TaxID=34480 RepID=A0ABR2WPW3_9FUNG